MCSHVLAIVFYLGTFYHPDLFPCDKCESLEAALKANCSNETVTYMGYDTPITTRGIFYVNTTYHSRRHYLKRLANLTTPAGPFEPLLVQIAPDSKHNKYDEKSKNETPFKPHKKKKFYAKDSLKLRLYLPPKDQMIDIVTSKEEEVNTTFFNEDTLPEGEGDRILEIQEELEEDEEDYYDYEYDDHNKNTYIGYDVTNETHPFFASEASSVTATKLLRLSSLLFVLFQAFS